MFAGLPGIGVGTLFYVLMAFWMPVRELPRVIQGTSTFDNWKLILRQMFYAVGIVVTVMFAERLMLWILGQSNVRPFSPSSWLYTELGHRANGSFLAAPIMASVILLVGVVMTVEVLRIVMKRPERIRKVQPEIPAPSFPDGVLDSSR